MLALFFAALAATSLVHAQDDINMVGVVAFIRSGERTPWIRSGTEKLTALGAQQMYQLGQNFRGRYIDQDSGATDLGVHNIENMSQSHLSPDQLFVQTPNDPYLMASAQAFMQGLYPPVSLNVTRNGPWPDGEGLLANHTVVDYPLDGYQYANIQGLGSLDARSVYINGHDQCSNAQLDSALYEISEQYLDTEFQERYFYEDLSLSWFNGDIPEGMLEYMNAYSIYDALSFYYNHDPNTFADLNNGNNSGVLNQTRYLADQDAWARYGNATSDHPSMRAVAGRTLASLLLGRLQDIVFNEGNATNGYSYPMTLLFGDFVPMLSFISLTEIDYQTQTDRWHAIPPFASTIILELFTRNNASPTDENNLWVRFSYHNGTDAYDGSDPQAFPMFRNGPSRLDMPWNDFESGMEAIMINRLGEWCALCDSPALFCWGVANTTTRTAAGVEPARSRSGVSPAVAGVIGALVTLAVAGILFLLGMFFGGIRFHRAPGRRKSSLGGFKGSAKLASDADLNLAKSGVAPAGITSLGRGGEGEGDVHEAGRRVGHERVGSWELRGKESGSGDLGDENARGSFDAIEAAMSKPVEPRESV